MKRILITGANSYIGTSFENYIKQFDGYQVDTVDMIDVNWRNVDFGGYDTVFHVAGIAHSDTGNVTEELKQKYYKVNTELTIETAKKAKADGVKQFVFMSSIIVYGTQNECITASTLPNPDNFYGDSKLRADEQIHTLSDDSYRVVSIRPPMIYGKGSKGNYPKLSEMAKRIPVFPSYPNKRSMLYIENLCEFIRLVIENCEDGYFYPQNRDYVRTSNMVIEIAKVHNRKIWSLKFFNPFISLFKSNILIKKVFGNLYYDKTMSQYKEDYLKFSFEESIRKTESKEN